MRPVSFKWIVRVKKLNETGKDHLCKARCVLRGDLQKPYLNFEPEALYAPVATYDSLRLIIALAASANLLLEGGDISNAYLYGSLDVPIIMEQPCNSTGRPAQPNSVCLVAKSLYGAKQAGHLWGTLLDKDLTSWSFKQSCFDQRLYYLNIEKEFVIVAVVVDDMTYAYNSRSLFEQVKSKLRATFDVKLFGELRSFIGLSITRKPAGINVDTRQVWSTIQ